MRLEALGSAIPNLVKVVQMLVLCEVAVVAKTRTKSRRMNVCDTELSKHEHVVCKFLECLQVDLHLLSNTTRTWNDEPQRKIWNDYKMRKPRTKKWYNQDEEI